MAIVLTAGNDLEYEMLSGLATRAFLGPLHQVSLSFIFIFVLSPIYTPVSLGTFAYFSLNSQFCFDFNDPIPNATFRMCCKRQHWKIC